MLIEWLGLQRDAISMAVVEHEQGRWPYRERSVACIHPETYRYYFAPERVSVLWSTLEVGSSISTIFEFLSKARAKHISCFCPAERVA